MIWLLVWSAVAGYALIGPFVLAWAGVRWLWGLVVPVEALRIWKIGADRPEIL
jgi:hypothetical protein